MAINPMQRKARNSFLLGMLLMLVIAGAVIALLAVQLKNYKDKELEELNAKVTISVLNQDVKSGQIITSDMIVPQEVNKNVIPDDAIGNDVALSECNLQDREGNSILTGVDENNNNEPYRYVKISEENGERNYEIFTEEDTGNYYIDLNHPLDSEGKRIEEDEDEETQEQKQYIELNSIPVVAKVDMHANSVLTRGNVTSADNISTDTVRREEYNMIVLPSQLETGDYIDIRLVLPTGQNYIVVSKKQVTIPTVNNVPSESSIWVNLSEGEILLLSNAIVEAYRIEGAKLYANIYTEPGTQQAAIVTYTPSKEVADLIENNPNIVQEAKDALQARYIAAQRNDVINSQIQSAGEEGDTRVTSGVEEDTAKSLEERQNYLDGLANQQASATSGDTSTAQ